MERYIVLDTETTNGFDDPMMYDCGWCVIDETGKVLKTRSFVVADIFLDEKELMKLAFFADKIPQYMADIADGKRELRRAWTIRKFLFEDCKTYNVKAIMAHNMRFDYKSCTRTFRWLTKSEFRYFFPYGVELWDTLKMARQTFLQDENYRTYCTEKGYVTKRNVPRLTAEILYRYMTKNEDFEEEHTGLADCLIEKEIFLKCMEMNADIDKKVWD